MIELRKLGAQRADRATEQHDLGPVHDQNFNEAADAFRRRLSVDLPLAQHFPRVRETPIDHRVQNFVLGFEVVVKVAARDVQSLRDVGERGVIVTLPIEQLIGCLNDPVSRCHVCHVHYPTTAGRP